MNFLNREDYAKVEAAALNMLVCLAWNRHAGPFQAKSAQYAAECLRREINAVAAVNNERAAVWQKQEVAA